MSRCVECIDPETGARCGRPGASVRLACPAGRPDAEGGPYCPEHGGEPRARSEAEREWIYVAPESVGDAAAVALAGQMCLRTQHAYVVIRHVPEEQGGKWLAWRGLGSRMVPIRRYAYGAWAQPNKRGGRKHKRAGQTTATTGTMSFPSRREAEESAVAIWRAHTRGDVDRIRSARGETLDWGLPVEPMQHPIMIVLEQGDSRSAWDIAVTLERVTRPGLCAISGLRPSGEVA